VVAVVYEFQLVSHQQQALARLLQADRAERPPAILARLLWAEGESVHLIVIWKSRDALDRHVATASAHPVAALLEPLGVRETPRIVEVAEFG
jgi:quinol monooxygenase YgiN